MITFYADTQYTVPAGYKWIINGQRITWGDTATLPPDPDGATLDTLFFQAGETARWDTILFNARGPAQYSFLHNECCGGFDLYNGKTSPDARVQFSFDARKRRIYLEHWAFRLQKFARAQPLA